ncbi:MAG TPA: fibronectin type III domain-containing protein [Usitatibacteraceae bacterium]
MAQLLTHPITRATQPRNIAAYLREPIIALEVRNTVQAGGGNAYLYQQILAAAYLVVAGDVLRYDIWVNPMNPAGYPNAGGIDLTLTTAPGSAGAVPLLDQDGVAINGNSAKSVGAWYSRTISLAGIVGKTISGVDLVNESDIAGVYSALYRNIRITDASGNTLRLAIWSAGPPAINTTHAAVRNAGIVVTNYDAPGWTGVPSINTFQSGGVAAEPFGTGDGATAAFQLKRTIAGYIEPILSVSGTPLIYKNDWQGNQQQYSVARSNYLPYTEALNNAAWSLASATIATGIADPQGGLAAATLTATAANGGVVATTGLTTAVAAVGTNSIWVRRRTGVGTVELLDPAFSAWSTIAVTGAWARFSFSGNLLAGNAYLYIRCNTSGDAIDIAFPQQEAGASMTSYVPSLAGGPASRTDYTIAGGLITFAVAPLNAAVLTWTGIPAQGIYKFGTMAALRQGMWHEGNLSVFPAPSDNTSNDSGAQTGGGFSVEIARPSDTAQAWEGITSAQWRALRSGIIGKVMVLEIVSLVSVAGVPNREIIDVRAAVAKAANLVDNKVIIVFADIDMSALNAIHPPNKFSTLDHARLFITHAGRPVNDGVGQLVRIPLSYIDNGVTGTGPFIFAVMEKRAGVIYTVQTIYRAENEGQVGAVVPASEYTVGTSGPHGPGYYLVTVSFTREQKTVGGQLYSLTAAVYASADNSGTVTDSRLVTNEIRRLLNLAGIATDQASFDTAAANAVAATMFCDAGYVAPRTLMFILNDLLFLARAKLVKTATGSFGIVQDVAQASVGAWNEADDEVVISGFPYRDKPAKVSLYYSPEISGTEKWNAVPRVRVTGGLLDEKRYYNPYIRDNTAADKCCDYYSKRDSIQDGLDCTIHAVQFDPLNMFTLGAAVAWIGDRQWLVETISRPADCNVLGCRAYDASIYNYTPSTLPANPSNTYVADYSQTFPIAPTGVVIVNDGVGTARVSWTPRTEPNVIAYRREKRIAAGAWNVITPDVVDASFTDGPLTQAVTVDYRVYTVDDVQRLSSASSIVSLTPALTVALDSQVSDGATYARILASEMVAGVPKLEIAGSGKQVGDSRNTPMISTAGLVSRISGATISVSSAAGTPATATLSVTAFTMYIGSVTLSYNAASVGVTGTNGAVVTYYIYFDDAAYAGGTPTLVATTTANAIAQADGRVYVGSVTFTFPTSGTGGGGGTGCVTADSVTPDGRRFGDLKMGDEIELCDPETLVSSRGTILFLARNVDECVNLITHGGSVLPCSLSAPIPTLERGYMVAPDCLGLTVPIRRDDIIAREMVIAIEPIGRQEIVHLHVADRCFWAGKFHSACVLHHNLKPPP